MSDKKINILRRYTMGERYRLEFKDSIKGIETKEHIESVYQSAIEEANKQRNKAYEDRDSYDE